MRPVPRTVVLVALVLVSALAGGLATLADGGDGDPLSQARRDMIQRRWDAAAEKLEAFLAADEKPAAAPEARILLARARILGGTPATAVPVLETALEKIAPASPWHAQARYLLAEALDGAGRRADASRVLAEEATRLESATHRGELAARLEALAREALAPAAPARPGDDPREPDYRRAALLFEAAARTIDPDGLDPALTPLVARTRIDGGDAAGALAEALRGLAVFGEEGRRADASAAARLLLVRGRAELAAGRPDAARKALLAVVDRERSDPWFADVHLLLGRTYGLPKTSSPDDVRAGIEHWRRYLETASSDGARDVRRDIIRSYLAAGLLDEFVGASRDYLAHHGDAPDAPGVLRAISTALASRGDHDGAVAVLEEFLKRYPDDARQADVRARIPELLFQKAIDAHRNERIDDALTALTTFVTRFPVHGHAPVAALEIGLIHEKAGRHAAARDVWLRARSRYGSLDPQRAASAGFKAALVLEEHDGDLEAAAAEYRGLLHDFASTPAAATVRDHLQAMEARSLELRAPRVITSDGVARVELVLRNVESVTIRVYPVDFEIWYRSKQSAAGGFESLDVALVEAAREVAAAPAEFRRYRQEKLDVVVGAEKGGRLAPGLYLVTAEDGSRRASAALLVSDLRAVVKRGPKSLFVFAQDVRTGDVVEGARVLVADGGRVEDAGVTGADGTWKADYDHDAPRSLFVIHDGHAAPTGALGGGAEAPTSFAARGWVTTDRGVYRPGESVRLHAILRRAGRDGYRVPPAGETVDVRIRGARGRILDRREVTVASFGTLSAAFDLPPEAPLGACSVEVQDGESTFTQAFDVKAWRPAEFEVRVAPEVGGDAALPPGTRVPVAVRVRDLFDNPVEGVRVFWRATRRGHGVDLRSVTDDAYAEPADEQSGDAGSVVGEGFGLTDADGIVRVEVTTEPHLDVQRYLVTATVVGDERTTQTGVGVFHTALTDAFGVVTTDRHAYREGDVIHAEIRTVGPSLRPVTTSGRLVVLARGGLEREPHVLETRPISTDLGGRAEVELTAPDADVVVLRFEADGDRGARFEATIRLRPEGYDADRDVRISVTKKRFLVGNDLVAYLDVPATKSPVLLTFEGQRVIDHRVLRPSRRREVVEWKLEQRHAPGVTVAAAQFHDGALRTSLARAEVRRRLTVEVTADRAEYRPGDEVELTLTTRDQLGRAVPASAAVAVVDRSALELGRNDKGDLAAYFRPPERPHRVETAASTAWSWAGGTSLIDQDLAEHARRQDLHDARRREAASGDEDFEFGLIDFAKERMDRAEASPDSDAINETIGLGGGAGGSYGGPRGGRVRKSAAAEKSMNVDKFAGGAFFTRSELEGAALRSKWVPTSASIPAFFDEEDGAVETVETRTDFRTVAFFAGDVVTDGEGRAVLRFELPENVTGWSVHAIGVTASTHVGEAETSFASRRPLGVDLSTPRFLVEGDRSSVRALVARHGPGEVDVEVALEASGSLSSISAPRSVRVSSGRRVAVDVSVAAERVGAARLRAAVTARGGAGDAVERAVDVLPFGEPMASGGGGVLDGSAILDFARAGAVVEGTGRCTLTISTGAHADLVDALRLLATSGNASVEGAVARLRASVALLELVDAAGLDLGIRRSDLADGARRDVLRVLAARRDDGTLGWWTRCGPDATVTATALEALVGAARLGLLPDQGDLTSVLLGTRALLGKPGSRDRHAFLACALSVAGSPDPNAINRIARASRRLSLRGLAALTVAADRAGREVQARELQGLLETRLDARGVGAPRGRRSDNDVLDAAWALRALMAREATGPRVHELVDELRARGRGAAWGGARATSAVAVALASVLRGAEHTPARGTIDVVLNGESVETIDLAGRHRAGSVVARLPFAKLHDGGNRLELRARDAASCRFVLLAEWMRPADRIEARPGAFTVRRLVLPRHEKDDPAEGWSIIVPESRPRPDDVDSLALVEEGTRYVVRLDVEASEEHQRVVVEDPIPAGLEVFDVRSSGHVHHERHDERLVFYFERLARGSTRIEYTVYGAHPGVYRAPPARAVLADDPRIAGATADTRLTVVAHGAASARLGVPAPTPDAKLARGRRAFRRGHWEECKKVLSPLLALELVPEHRDRVMTMLFTVGLRTGASADAVDLYDRIVLRSGAPPDMSSADRLILGRAFDEVGDHERAAQIFRGVIGAAFVRERAVKNHEIENAKRDSDPASLVREREGMAALAAGFPDSEAVRNEWFASAEAWFETPDPRRSRARSVPDARRFCYERGLAEVTRVMSHVPTSRAAEAAGHRMLSRLRGLGLAARAEREAQWFLERHPASIHADDAQLLVMQAAFARGDYGRAGEAATALTAPKWFAERRPGAKPTFSEHRDEAIYTLGRIAHVEGRIEEAVERYGAVADEFDDARQSHMFFTEKLLELPEVEIVASAGAERVGLDVKSKNVHEARAWLYSVDLGLVLTVRKSLRALNRVDLTGLAPLRSFEVPLAKEPYREHSQSLDLGELPVGSWLVVLRAGSITRTGIVVVSPLRMTLQRHGADVRVWVTRVGDGAPVAGAEVLAGDGSRIVGTGTTDERGILVLRSVPTGLTVVASKGEESALAGE